MSPEALIVIFVALAAGSLVKGISGLGLPLVAIPVMAGFLGVERAVAIMIIPGILMNFWLMWTYRDHAVRIPSLPVVAAAGVAGVVAGALILSAVPDRYLVLFMAVWLGLYLLSLLCRERVRMPAVISRHAPLLVVGFAGIVQGAVGTSGPVLAPYVHSLKLKQPQYVFAVSVLFQIFAFTQLTSFLWLGLIDTGRALESLMACVPIAIFLPLAVRLSRFFSDRAFDMLIVALLLVIEGRLIWRLVAGSG
jgi:uncharacterized membrane protein YfcA